MSADADNIRHLEECPGCDLCEDLMEFYMTCDDCGSWGHNTSIGFIMHKDQQGTIRFLCETCLESRKETK